MFLQKNLKKWLAIVAFLAGVFIAMPAHAQFEHNETIYVDLAWTCNGYTPVNYEGKSLPIRGSLVTVSAMPYFKINNQLVQSNKLNYKWFLDDEIISSNNIPEFSFITTKFRSYTHEVRVIVSISDESVSSQEWIAIKIYNPEIQVYEYDGAAQVNLKKGVGSEILTSANSTSALAAIPYYFNISNLQELSYNWAMQGTQIINQLTELPQVIELKIGSGLSYLEKTISLITANKFNALESSIKNFILKINE